MHKMIKISQDYKRSCIEIDSNIPFDIVHDAITPWSSFQIPENTIFQIKKGKKEFDIISLYEAATIKFYSHRIIEILSRYVDMSDKCYPINIENCDKQYYVIYNLVTSALLFNYEFIKEEPFSILPPKEDLPLYNVTRIASADEIKQNTFCGFTESGIPFGNTYHILITPEIMEAMKKEKITNIDFREWDVYDEDEYAEWKRKHGIIRDY